MSCKKIIQCVRFGTAVVAGALWAFSAQAAPEEEFEDFGSGVNMSGESSASDRTQLIQDPPRNYSQASFGQTDPMRIEAPRGPNGMPQRPVRGMSRTEEMELEDIEQRYNMGTMSEAEYYQRKHAIMARIGMEPEY